MKVYCDSSLTEFCVVFGEETPIVLPHTSKVTVNEGEYIAVLTAVNMLKSRSDFAGSSHVICSDSELVVKQVEDWYSTRRPSLQRLCHEVRGALTPNMLLIWIPREKNPAGIKLESIQRQRRRK